MHKDEFMERLKVHKVKNAKLQQELGACKRELETYRKGFIEQVDIIKELQQENEKLKEEKNNLTETVNKLDRQIFDLKLVRRY